MNVFLRELRARRTGLIVWSLAMGFFMWLCMVKYQTIASDPAAVQAVFTQMPETVKTVFGMNGLDATTVAGYFGICFLFVAIMLAVHAALLGSGLLTVEPLNKTTEFLYTKPKSRRRIVTAKLFAGLLQLAVVWGATYLASWGSISAYASMNNFGETLLIFMLASAVIQALCFSLGVCVAAIVPSANSAGKLLTGFIFGSYALSLISQFQGYTWLHYLSIFRYFDALDIIHTQTLKLHYVVICLGVGALALLVVYTRYPQRDLTR